MINFNIVHAFFLITDHSDKISIDHTTLDRSTQDNNVFQLYDNYFFKNTNSFLIKKIDGFISVDQVKINIPLKILVRDSIYTENSIDRMLLANLRIKKLILEYTKLQKKAQLLLQDSKMAGMRKINNKITKDKETDKIGNIESEKDKINKKLFNINRLSRLVQDDTSSNSSIFFENYAELKNKMNPSSKAPSYFTESSAINKNNLDFVHTDINTTRQIYTRKDNSQLPWVFKFFLKILNYILNNRVEIILYIIVIAVTGYFISFQVRR